MHVTDQLFGGKRSVQLKLATAIKDARVKQNLTNEQLDEICGFGGKFPVSARFETHPDELTGKTFCRAALALELSLDDYLKPNLDEATTAALVEEMERDGVHVTAACGGGDVSRIPLEQQVPAFVLLKAIEELH